MSWAPPSSLEERIKRTLVPPRLELARIVRRELNRGESELRLLPYLADPLRAALDIGANRGIWTHVLAKLCPWVHAFEPNPKMFAVLNAARPANATAHAVAASDRTGIATFMVPRYGRGWSNQHGSLETARMGDNPFNVVEVAARRLDEIDLPPIGFIKIDVEGHEQAVLDGASALLAGDRPTLVLELEERHTGRPIEAMLAGVQALGYRGLFLRQGRLVDLSAFDPQADHRDCADDPAYVNNFIFLPI